MAEDRHRSEDRWCVGCSREFGEPHEPSCPERLLPIGRLEVGDRIEVYGATGCVQRIFEHGTAIGDGSVAWRTLRVVFDGERWGSTVGPKRVTERVPWGPSLPEKRLERAPVNAR